ncbi:hypothetical protein Tco_0931005, partial [Tanacetum coccineum]
LKKAVKERDDLKDKIAKWEESSKNLDEILNSQMSAKDKTCLGYSTQLNELSSNHETDSENSFSVFDGRSSDEQSTLANDRSSKANGYKVVPPPITGNFLTPRADISFTGLDEYAIRNKIIKSQITELNTKTSETTCKTNANTEKPKSVNDEEEVSEVQTVRPETQIVKTRDDKSGQNSNKQGIGVLTKTRSVCTARPSISTVRPVCTARPSISTSRPVCTARPSISTARPVCTARPSISTARPFAPKIAQTSGAIRPIYPRMDNVRPRGSYSPIKRSYYTKPAFRPKDLKQDVKTFGVQNMTTAGTRAVVNTGKVDHSCSRRLSNPDILLHDHAVVDSGCSSHMTGNKAYLSYYEDYNGGFVAFGSDPKGGKITGKGKIRNTNLDFDDVYFVDE